MGEKAENVGFIQRKLAARKAANIRKFLERQKYLKRKLREHAPDILASQNFLMTKKHIQHGTMTVNAHCLDVAKYSLAISEKLHLNCSEKELIRGALLHDYFLYDWHDPKYVPLYKLHGFHHPRIAWENAMKEYKLTEKEQEIIRKHMWPLTLIPPTCREAWIVTVADKWCSTLETIKVHKGSPARNR